MQMVKGFCCHLFPPMMPYFGAGLTGRGGAGRLQPVWVEDVARCFVAALEQPETIGETYPMGGPGSSHLALCRCNLATRAAGFGADP